MIARGFKPVGWVAAAGAAALGCYMVSLNVAAERAELASLERRIIETKQEIRTLHTELGTRGRLAQLDRWNAEVLALSAPTSAQFLQDEFTLARFDQTAPMQNPAQVRMAAAERVPENDTLAPDPGTKPQVIFAAASAPEVRGVQPLVRRASLVINGAGAAEPAPMTSRPALKKAGLLSEGLMREIGSAAQSEGIGEGLGGQ